MKSLQQLVTRKAWLEAQLVKVTAEIKARQPVPKEPEVPEEPKAASKRTPTKAPKNE